MQYCTIDIKCAPNKTLATELSMPLEESTIPETACNRNVLECYMADASNYTFGNIPLRDIETPCSPDLNIKDPRLMPTGDTHQQFTPRAKKPSG